MSQIFPMKDDAVLCGLWWFYRMKIIAISNDLGDRKRLKLSKFVDFFQLFRNDSVDPMLLKADQGCIGA